MKEKKRVLLVVRWPVGGIRTFMRYVYSRFDAESWQFTLLAPDLDEVRVLVEEDLGGQDIQYIPLARKPTGLTFLRKIYQELRATSYILVHSHGFTSGICTALPARLTHTRHFMTSHDVINANQFQGVKGNINKRIMGLLFQQIEKIHSVSHDAQVNLLEHFPALSRKNGRCVVVPNGIEVERFLQTQPRDLRKELELDEAVFLIGFLGRFMSQKGFRYLVDAVELLSEEEDLPKKLLVVTFGDGGFAAREKRNIESRGLQKYFHHMPFIPNVAATIKGLDVVAMPSLWEACGLLAMESLVAGTPLICFDCIGLREVVKDTPARILPKANSMALKDALLGEMFASSCENSKSFSQTAATQFNVNKTIAEIGKIYDSLTS